MFCESNFLMVKFTVNFLMTHDSLTMSYCLQKSYQSFIISCVLKYQFYSLNKSVSIVSLMYITFSFYFKSVKAIHLHNNLFTMIELNTY